jgi:hypothetical protein
MAAEIILLPRDALDLAVPFSLLAGIVYAGVG